MREGELIVLRELGGGGWVVRPGIDESAGFGTFVEPEG